MNVIHEVLSEFCACSGHRVSVAKTQIFFSKNCDPNVCIDLGQRLGFEVVGDLEKYLGVPLLHERVTKATYAYLLDRMEKRLAGWVANSLSLAGRITLAKVVLQAIPSYVMQATMLPKGLCHEMERIIRRFVWGGGRENRSISLVSWENMRKPLMDGGMGFKDLSVQNNAFLMKVGFEILTQPSKLWVKVIKEKYGWRETVPSSINRSRCSRLWKGLDMVWDEVKRSILWNVRKGEHTDFWYDTWVDLEGPLVERCSLPFTPLPTPVVRMVTTLGEWDWRYLETLLSDTILAKLEAIQPPRAWFGEDVPCYRWEENRCFSVRSAYRMLVGAQLATVEDKWRVVWGLKLPHRVRMFMWLVLRHSLFTNMERCRRKIATDRGCWICRRGDEDEDHVLRRCSAAKLLWQQLVPRASLHDFETMEFDAWLLYNLKMKANTRIGGRRGCLGLR
ncbi:hypothetical protein like AT3G24255 [Hibiscus trionum]|uniref:Reverse transcriptase zinc-binding domain-containing protein n=1 Tax=Hibiscus trionum TaxID=183268 RepID=A0A9W7MTE8_HIBTR|nr:hypothetical protein like AT3G24255 [Hibiscus trionum]